MGNTRPDKIARASRRLCRMHPGGGGRGFVCATHVYSAREASSGGDRGVNVNVCRASPWT